MALILIHLALGHCLFTPKIISNINLNFVRISKSHTCVSKPLMFLSTPHNVNFKSIACVFRDKPKVSRSLACIFFGDSQNFQKHFYVFQPEKLDIRYHRFSSDTIGYHVLPSSGPQAFEATNSDNVVFV